MSTYFLSDIHLAPDRVGVTAIFLQFLTTTACNADAVYILGDLFEMWLGDDNTSEFIEKIKAALLFLTNAGVPVYVMRGNRDFLLGEKFAAQTGIQFLTDPTVIDLYGTKTLLMHGDLLCTDDTAYLRFRKWVQKAWIQKFFLTLPLIWREALAKKIRGKSQKLQQQSRNVDIMDATQEGITRYLCQYSVTQLFHGHTHRPSIHYFQFNGTLCRRFVLSDWEKTGNVLVCNSEGQNRLHHYSD